ncbi:hypothetical protein [Silanimonas sp.]|uniref:hypothetical protein n=1 Tax=Silanimonas sp. TaxID=1929290 RepID=UPI0037CB4DA1
MKTLGPQWRWLGGLLAVACLGAFVWQFSEGLNDMPGQARRMGFGPFSVAVAGFAAGGFAVFLAYARLAAAMGIPRVPLAVLGHVYFVGQLLKYLPGRVWGFAFQIARASDLAPPSRWAALLMVHFAAAVAALVAVAAAIEATTGHRGLPWSVAAVGLSFGATAVIAFEWPGFRQRLPFRAAIVVSALLHLGALLQALALVPLARSLAPEEDFIGAVREGGHYLLAWLAGYLAVITPAGLGVREGAFAALSDGLSPAALLTLAAAARLAMMLADLCLGLAFLRYPGASKTGEPPAA